MFGRRERETDVRLVRSGNRFAAGKGTALIVDIGSDLVSVVPVCDGYAIRSGKSLVEYIR